MASSTPSSTPSPFRLLAIIELQNAIAAAAMNADEVMTITADRARSVLSADTVLVGLVEGDDLVFRTAIGAMAQLAGSRAPRGSGLAGRCIAERRAMRIDDTAAAPDAVPELGSHAPAAVACVPLLYGEIAVGVLEAVAGRGALSDEDVEILRMLAQIIAIALHRAYTYPRPRYDSLQDALTGLGNRRAFDERLEAELNRNRRFGHSFSLALVQLDGLESAIDRHGQAAGDEMLRRIATILKAHTRMIDGCFRIRADELAIVMPGTSLQGAQVVAERCRAHSAEARACDGGVRLGFGVVAAVERGETGGGDAGGSAGGTGGRGFRGIDEGAAQILARAAAALALDSEHT
ncbi:MAG TPA: sensor domain-containing diguanylate cyclase [Kofleriaceae bacterium]|nr:sensor domain-containing diguanylate cyclase [Kofleriaceae bacterium]